MTGKIPTILLVAIVAINAFSIPTVIAQDTGVPIVVGENDDDITTVDINGTTIQSTNTNGGQVEGVVYSDNKNVIYAANGASVESYHTDNLTGIDASGGLASQSLQFLRNGGNNTLYTGGDSPGRVIRLNSTLDIVWENSTFNGQVHDAAVTNDGEYLYVAEGTRLWKLYADNGTAVMSANTSTIATEFTSVELSRDDSKVIVGLASNGIIRIKNSTTLQTEATYSNQAGEVKRIRAGVDGDLIFSVTSGGNHDAWYLNNQTEKWSYDQDRDNEGLAVGPNGVYVYSGNDDNELISLYVSNGTVNWINTDFDTSPVSIDAGSGGIEPPTPTPTPSGESPLELEVDNWQPLNSSNPYEVKFEGSDVTNSATVTSSNSTIIAVNTSANTLDSFGIVGRVQVTAEYQGENVTENVTTGPRTLENIGIMPPEQWPCSFLGCDEAPGGGDNPHNIGSSMQWLWLIIVIMVAATRFAENPFVGVGTGIVFSILVWVLEYIDLGAVLITVFSGLLIGGLMARTQMGRGVTRDNEEAARISVRGKDQP